MTGAAVGEAVWRRIRRRAGVAALVIVALLLGYVAVVGVLRSRTLTLPASGGPHPVGRTITTVAAGGGTADEPRRATWIWYPADSRSADTAPPAEYVPEDWFGPGSLPPTTDRSSAVSRLQPGMPASGLVLLNGGRVPMPSAARRL